MSLRLRAVLIAGLSLVILWVAATAWMMRDVHVNLDRTLDGRLAMSARMVAGLLERAALAPGASSADFSEAVRVRGNDGIACEIRSLRGEVLARTTSAPHSEFESLPAGFSTREVQGSQWRIYVLRAGDYQITTADRVEQRDVLIKDLLYAAGVPFLLAMFGGLFALWIGIGRGLMPLKALSRQLRGRRTDDTTPIAVDHSSTELRPVLDAMNGLLARLAQALSSQRAFTDAAAHELRTPLTVIDTHLQVTRMSEGEEAQMSLESAEEGVKRLRRILDQMMLLARTEEAASLHYSCTSVQKTVQEMISRMESDAQTRLMISNDGVDDVTTIVPASLLESALRNLVDNAMHYSPEGKPVEVMLSFDAKYQMCRIAISDRGPGLGEDEEARIGKRFWRGDQGRRNVGGAGLGISIVHAIAQRFGGSLELKARDGGGLIAVLSLPSCVASQ